MIALDKIRLALVADRPGALNGPGRYGRALVDYFLRAEDVESVTVTGTGLDGYRVDGVRTVSLSSPLPSLSRTYLPFLLFSPRFVAGVHDVVHLLSGIPLRLNDAIPSIVTVHDLGALKGGSLHPLHRRLVHRLFLGRTLRRFDVIVCDSETTRKDLATRYPSLLNRTRVIPLGVGHPFMPREASMPSIDPAATPPSTPGPFILALGPPDRRKNVAGVIEAYRLLRAGGFTPRLVIAGGGGELDRAVRRMVAQKRLEGEVVFTGALPDEGLAELYRHARVFVYPSLWEGFGLPILEAMSCGCPVVTSGRGATAETAGAAAVLVDPRNHEQIAAAVASLCEDSERRDRYVSMGRDRVTRFSWNRCGEETLKVYLELLKRGGGRLR